MNVFVIVPKQKASETSNLLNYKVLCYRSSLIIFDDAGLLSATLGALELGRSPKKVPIGANLPSPHLHA